MLLVDQDRLLYARDGGYAVSLGVLTPPDCSPKHHVIKGRPVPAVAAAHTCCV